MVISVAEPWDFTSPNGDNVISASIVEFDEESGILIAETPYVVKASGARGTRLRLRARHQGDTLSDLLEGDRVPVNVGIIETERSGEKTTFAITGTATLERIVEI
jgi:hypothetical protein